MQQSHHSLRKSDSMLYRPRMIELKLSLAHFLLYLFDFVTDVSENFFVPNFQIEL